MDFFRSQWAPVRSVQPEFQFKTPEVTATARRAPRVVQIPVHFVGSEATRSASALKIQKVFRGFLVRKSVKKIMEIKREVEVIEARVSQWEVVDLIKKDEKERLKVNETLMALLFKLDAVSCGVDSGIRVCRKAVIRKAIALQERVDSMAYDQTQEIDDVVVENVNDGKVEVEEYHKKAGCSTEDALNYDESTSNTCNNREDENGYGSAEECECVEQKVAENHDEHSSEMKMDEHSCVEGDDAAPGAEPLVEQSSLSGKVNEEERSVKTPALSECEDMGHEEEIDDVSGMMGGDEKDSRDADDNDKKKNKELLEKMVDENGKMMKMMTELFRRNETQARMLNTLTLRLEQLEKAFACDKIKRKKKRHCN